MKRADKETFVSEFTQSITDSNIFALMSFNKLTVEQMTEFRLALRKKGLRVKVVKNTLAKRVFEQTPFGGVVDQLGGPTLVAYGSEDPIESAKAIWEWVEKDGVDLKVKGGAALGDVMSESQIQALSKLPGRDELFVGFLWALKSAPTKVLYALQDAPRKLGYAVAALKEKKEKESSQ